MKVSWSEIVGYAGLVVFFVGLALNSITVSVFGVIFMAIGLLGGYVE